MSFQSEAQKTHLLPQGCFQFQCWTLSNLLQNTKTTFGTLIAPLSNFPALFQRVITCVSKNTVNSEHSGKTLSASVGIHRQRFGMKTPPWLWYSSPKQITPTESCHRAEANRGRNQVSDRSDVRLPVVSSCGRCDTADWSGQPASTKKKNFHFFKIRFDQWFYTYTFYV